MPGMISSLTAESILSSAAPTTSNPGDAAAAGTGTLAARDDHDHAREAFGAVGDITNSTFNGKLAGTTGKVADAGHRHGFDTGSSPVALAFNNTSSEGTGDKPSRFDHRHVMPHVERKKDVAHNSAWTFAAAFTAAPLVVATQVGDGSSSKGRMITIASVSTTAVTLLAWTSNSAAGAGSPDEIHALAMDA